MKKETINSIVINQVNEVVSTFEENQKFNVIESTILFGPGSLIDSLSLVSVIVDLEAIFLEEYGLNISLTDDKAMAREKSPFENITTLVDYIFELIDEQNNN
jgi:acyl carrier protein